MKNQMYTLGRVGIRALGILAVCAGVSACTDDYTLDDEKPEWLGESVYVRLMQEGQFNNYLRLMDDLGMKDVLSRTGSRTVFAANDAAFNQFYASNALLPELNAWHNATSYDKLTRSQKALLAKSTMLNNAITMETLSTQESSLERGKYLRRPTLVSVADSVTFMHSQELPYTYNETGDVDFWARFRSKSFAPGYDDGSGTGLYLTDGDGTDNMMLCFTPEQRAKQNVTMEDFKRVMNLSAGEELSPTDVYVYDAKVVRQDITCQNGYIDMVDKVIYPLPNMAEVIRTNGQTNIFSHILDRFSAPVYVHAYNEAYRLAHPDFKDTIFTKWYFSGEKKTSLLGSGDAPVTIVDKSGVKHFRLKRGSTSDAYDDVPVTYSLKFDPAWNACSLTAGERAENDMAAMFVPDDEAMLAAFKEGSLKAMLDEYAGRVNPAYVTAAYTATVSNLEPLYQAIDQIPLHILQSLVNNLMQTTYNGSVEHKFKTLKNDAQESLFEATDSTRVKKVELACNGAVYIMADVYSPADYSSVAAPAYINNDKRVMKFAIYNGSDPTETDYMRGMNYYAYLKAMKSRFTLFLPDDDAMKYIYNPMSFASAKPRFIELYYNVKLDNPEKYKNPGNPILNKVWEYNKNTGASAKFELVNANLTMDDVAGILADVLQTHTLVHQSHSDLISQASGDINDRDQYFVTKSNDAVKVTYEKNESGQVVVKYVQGGFQIENEQKFGSNHQDNDTDSLRVGTVRCNVKNYNLFKQGGNGDTYVLDVPIIPAVKSVYGVLSEHKEFGPFLRLCESVNDSIIEACGFYKDARGRELSAKEKELLKNNTYSIFTEKNSTLDMVTSFFNQYQYTVFVPDSVAMEECCKPDADGKKWLYDWDDITADFIASTEIDTQDGARRKFKPWTPVVVAPGDTLFENQDSIRIRAKITYLFNFIRLHFMDTSVFADNASWNGGQSFATSCFYQTSPTQGNFMKLYIERGGQGAMTVQGMNVAQNGLCGEKANVLDVVDYDYPNPIPLRNMMAREIVVVDNTNSEANIQNQSVSKMNNKRVGTSSSAVIHLIDQVLRYTNEKPNFENPARARRYLKYNRIVNNTQGY